MCGWALAVRRSVFSSEPFQWDMRSCAWFLRDGLKVGSMVHHGDASVCLRPARSRGDDWARTVTKITFARHYCRVHNKMLLTNFRADSGSYPMMPQCCTPSMPNDRSSREMSTAGRLLM